MITVTDISMKGTHKKTKQNKMVVVRKMNNINFYF